MNWIGEGELTAGLNRPPLTRKNTHTVTIRLNPKIKLMYNSTLVFGAVPLPDAASWLFWAMLVPPKEKKRNMKVPANSESAAMNSMRHRFTVGEDRLVGCCPGLDFSCDVSFRCRGSMFLSAMMKCIFVQAVLLNGSNYCRHNGCRSYRKPLKPAGRSLTRKKQKNRSSLIVNPEAITTLRYMRRVSSRKAKSAVFSGAKA